MDVNVTYIRNFKWGQPEFVSWELNRAITLLPRALILPSTSLGGTSTTSFFQQNDWQFRLTWQKILPLKLRFIVPLDCVCLILQTPSPSFSAQFCVTGSCHGWPTCTRDSIAFWMLSGFGQWGPWVGAGTGWMRVCLGVYSPGCLPRGLHVCNIYLPWCKPCFPRTVSGLWVDGQNPSLTCHHDSAWVSMKDASYYLCDMVSMTSPL